MEKIPSLETCRDEPSWNPEFDKEIFELYKLWYEVKSEVHDFYMRKNLTESEEDEKKKLRKAVKERCCEFMNSMEPEEEAKQKQKKLIGAGTFGEIWTTKLKEKSPTFIKKISRNIANDVMGIQIEVIILTCLIKHKHIPKLIYAGYTVDGKWCTIMEYFTGGTLWYHIQEEIKRKQAQMEPKINFEQKKYIAYHIALGIEELHKRRVTHGDLKPNNIVLTRDGHVRLIDFGRASNLNKEPMRILPRQVAQYSSPEVWNEKLAGLASDWFSYGVNIAYLFQLRNPFEKNTMENAQFDQPDLSDDLQEDVKKFILKLLDEDPDKRLSKVSSHEFFNSITETPFQPGDVDIPVYTPSKEAVYFTDDPYQYELIENVIRIPPSEFFSSDYFQLIN